MSEHGERGATGDTGQAGPEGPVGMIGPRGVIGERGRVGDHGQAGDPGRTGPQGDPGHVLSRAKTITLFGFVVLCFFILAYRVEVLDHNGAARDERIQESTRVACLRANDNSAAINGFLDLQIANTSGSTLLTPAEQRQRIAGYEAAKVDLLKCP